MAEETTPKGDPKAEEAKPAPAGRSKRRVLLGGGALAIVALGWALALVAVPNQHEAVVPESQGPALLNVSPASGFQVNLSGMGGKHYLAMNVMVEVDAIAEAHVTERASEPLCQARLSDAVLKVSSRKTKADLDDALGKELFREDLRQAIEQVLFPVHVGSEESSDARHAESGLRPGLSNDQATMRGPFHDHVLKVDAAQKTIQLDAGQVTPFEGSGTDLEVCDENGKCIFVDVSDLDPAFHGEVHAGVLGTVRTVYFTAFLIQ